MDIAAAAHENGTPEQLVHQQLLDQLAKVPEISDLSPEELLAELQALQLAAWYGTAEEVEDDTLTADGERICAFSCRGPLLSMTAHDADTQ